MTALPSLANPMLLFGCGNMGRALLDGWLAGSFDPAAFVVVDPYAKDLPVGVGTIADRKFGIALLAVKPQIFAELAGDFETLLAPNALVISILAGTRIETLQAKLPGRKIIRLMPNLAAALGKSPLGLFPWQDGLDELLAPLGNAFWLNSEEQMDAVTALTGSGPAFVYRFIDALAAAGAKLGLSPEQALGLATAMVEGAAQLAATSDADPKELARRVTSPGGTTAAGLAVLDADGALEGLVEATLAAARDRGVELSES
jgi:pyrroline-5-carboxylate reductase